MHAESKDGQFGLLIIKHGPTRATFIISLIIIIIITTIATRVMSNTIIFFLSQADFFYLLTVGVVSYCCTCSHSLTHT